MCVSESLRKFRDETLLLSPERQRFAFYQKHVPANFSETVVDEVDGKLIYRQATYKALFNKRLFLKPLKCNGFTFEKGKLKLWNGFSMALHLSETFLKLRGFEWLAKEGFYPNWLTKGLLEKVLRGKVTNPTEACKYLIGAYRWPKTTSPELLRRFIKNKDSKPVLLTRALVAKDLNAVLSLKDEPEFIGDLVKQALVLDKKVDFTWSDKRVRAEHDGWTKAIMALELELFEDEPLSYGTLELPGGVQLLSTKKEVFCEGTAMSHCIYTNYWDVIQRGSYIAMHVDTPLGGATVGLHQNYFNDSLDEIGNKIPSWTIDQKFGKGNRVLSDAENTLMDKIFTKEFLLQVAIMMAKAFKVHRPVSRKLWADVGEGLPF